MTKAQVWIARVGGALLIIYGWILLSESGGRITFSAGVIQPNFGAGFGGALLVLFGSYGLWKSFGATGSNSN